MNRPTREAFAKSLTVLVATGAAACLAACSSAVGGAGSGGSSAISAPDSAPISASDSALPADSAPSPAPVTTATATVTHTSSSHPATSSSSAVTGLPQLNTFTVSTPTCASKSGTVNVTVSWTSKNATEAWINQPPTATTAGDPRTETPNFGPLAPNGTKTLTFDCTQQYNYYNIGVYNPSTTQRGGEDQQVVNNLPFP